MMSRDAWTLISFDPEEIIRQRIRTLVVIPPEHANVHWFRRNFREYIHDDSLTEDDFADLIDDERDVRTWQDLVDLLDRTWLTNEIVVMNSAGERIAFALIPPSENSVALLKFCEILQNCSSRIFE